MPATYEPIATTTLSSSASSVAFSGIPNTYTDLRISWTGITTSGSTLLLNINSDTNTNYSFTDLIGNGASALSNITTNASSIIIHYNGLDSTIRTFVPIDIFSYAGSTYKTMLFGWNADRDGSGTVKYSVGVWRSTSAITSLSFTSNANFAAGTTATLYGIKAA